MNAVIETIQFIPKNGILYSNVENCFVRLDTVPETAALEIFFPRNADEDRWKIRDILNEPCIIKKEWIDSGLRLFLKDVPKKTLLITAESIIKKTVSYFSNKYPHDVFKQYKNYSCGKLTRVILLHINQLIVLKYCEELRADFTKNYFKVILDESEHYEKIYISTYEAGTLEYKNGSFEMHRWENEDEAQSASYLSRRYTQRLLDGVIDEPDTKTKMIGLIKSSMDRATIETDDRRLFETALELLENCTREKHS